LGADLSAWKIRYRPIAALIASAVRSASAAMVNVGLAVADVGNRDEPANQRLGWSWLRPLAFATDVSRSAPIRVVPMVWPAPSAWGRPDLGRAERAKQSLINFARRRQRGRGVIIQPEEDTGLGNADRVGPIEVRRDPAVAIGQLLGERHQGGLSRRMRANRIEKRCAGQSGGDGTLGRLLPTPLGRSNNVLRTFCAGSTQVRCTRPAHI
jgi:hypothetical protein